MDKSGGRHHTFVTALQARLMKQKDDLIVSMWKVVWILEHLEERILHVGNRQLVRKLSLEKKK